VDSTVVGRRYSVGIGCSGWVFEEAAENNGEAAENKLAGGPRCGFALGEMRGVDVDVEAHVAGVVSNDGGMGSAIV
jgi:hypothetical protein